MFKFYNGLALGIGKENCKIFTIRKFIIIAIFVIMLIVSDIIIQLVRNVIAYNMFHYDYNNVQHDTNTTYKTCKCNSNDTDEDTALSKTDYLTDINITLAEKYHINISGEFMFHYKINNINICSGIDHLYYIILVIVAPTKDGYERRMAIRKTWGQNNFIQRHPSRTVFLLGNTTNDIRQIEIEKENSIYRDIIQADFKDSYHNLALKLLMGVKWCLTYCNKFKFLFRANADIYVDINVLIKLLSLQFNTITRSMIGYHVIHSSISRDTQKCGKFCVSKNDIKHKKFYPNYLAGLFFILTSDLLEELYISALTINFFWIEDVFITGFVRLSMKHVKYINIAKYYLLNEYNFINKVGSGSYFLTSTNTYYGVFMASMLGLSKADTHFIGKNRLMALLKSFTRPDN